MATVKLTPKAVREFTREDPVTKVHLFNCFGPKPYRPRAVIEARGEIGINAIKYLVKNGYATTYCMRSVDYWELTTAGHEWLEKGLLRELELHPERVRALHYPAPVKRTAAVKRPAARRVSRRA